MTTVSTASTISNSTANLIGILMLLLIGAVLTGMKIPLLSNHRVIILTLIIVGMAMCALGGIGRVAAVNAWAHPISILGYLIGALLLVVMGAELFGKHVPPITSDRAALLVIAGLMAVKWVLTQIHPLIK